MRIDIVIYPGFDELDAIGPFEVLRQAKAGGAQLVTRMVSLAGEAEITASHGLRVRSEGLLAAPGRPDLVADLVVVPGGGWSSRAKQGAWAEAQSGALPAALGKLHGDGAMMASVCTGAMLLAAAGILRGRHATTHHAALDELRAQGVELINARVVDDGDIITAGGVTSGLDLALWLVERFAGAEFALQVQREMEYERRGAVWHGRAQAAPAGGRPS
jgi:transcriptional regulator GlxA family with amidase domain